MLNKDLVGKLYFASGILDPQYMWLINHMMGVAHVAGFLSRVLEYKGITIDTESVETAAMVHDIGKLFDTSPRGHVTEGARFLQEQGVNKTIISLVKKHQVWVFERNEIANPSTWDEKLVFLADLAFDNCIIPVKERVEDLLRRYAQNMPQGRKRWLQDESQKIYQEVLEIIAPQTLPF